MAIDPRTPTPPYGALESEEPSVYEDAGYGSDAALDAFTGEFADEEPVDPAALRDHHVTAVLVAHDGHRWLDRTLESLAALDRRPDRIVGVDTGSRDDSERRMVGSLGAHSVITAPPSTGFGAAVQKGIDAADDRLVGAAAGDRTAWIWLLHDDCAPRPDALRRMLETAVRRPDAGVIGPKVIAWRDTGQLLEIGLTVTGQGRRHTGLDKREYDQGQHDDRSDVLAVGSAGMLVRRDVWDRLGGFDPVLKIFRDDIDFGWRANQAGYAVVISPGAVVQHVEAAAHGRRRLGASRDRPHLADRRNALYVMLVNTSVVLLPWVLFRVIVGAVFRAVGFLFGKQPALAAEEFVALLSVLVRPDRLIRGRLARRRIRRQGNGRFRKLFPPRGQQARQAAENLLGMLSGSTTGQDVPGSARRAGEDDELPAGDDTFILRIVTHPAVLMVTGLIVITAVAIRSLIGSGSLVGGALLAAPDDVGALWQTYAESWHGVGLGSATDAPPYLGVIGVLGTMVRSASLAVDIVMLASVPLAGLTFYLLARRVVAAPWLRVWAAVVYALLPATTGAIAAGRLGTVVATVLTPLLVLAVARTIGSPGSPGPFRAAWSAGLLLAVVTAFVPLAWVLALVLAGLAGATMYRDRVSWIRFAVILGMAPIVLVPWTGSVLRRPMLLVTEAGLPGPGLSDTTLAPWSVLLQNPGGPGSAPVWLGAGVALAGWAALLRRDRRRSIGVAWAVAGVGLVGGVVVSRIAVSGPTLETPVSGWPGYPSVLVGGALALAAILGAEGGLDRVRTAGFGWRQPAAVIALAAAVATPVVGVVWWIARGAEEPLARRDPAILPAYVADAARQPEQVRTLVLTRADDGRITYALLRDSGPRLGDAETSPLPEDYGPIDETVADLISGRGGVDGARLADFAAKYVYLPRPYDPDLADTLDTVSGLVRTSAPEGGAMWQVEQPMARVWVALLGEDGQVVPPEAGAESSLVAVPSGQVDARGEIPAGEGGDRMLIVAELADSGWEARMNGQSLPAETYDGWAQAFRVGPEAGEVTLAHESGRRAVWLTVQGVAVVLAVVLALPGMRRERGAVDDVADVEDDSSGEFGVVPGSGELPVPRRRMRQAAVAGARRRGGGRGTATEGPPDTSAPGTGAPDIRSEPGSDDKPTVRIPTGSPAAAPAWGAPGSDPGVPLRAPVVESPDLGPLVDGEPVVEDEPTVAEESPGAGESAGAGASGTGYGGRRARRAGTSTPSERPASADSDDDRTTSGGGRTYKGKRAAGRRAKGRRGRSGGDR